MNVLFIYSDPILKSFQQGIAYISAVLKKEGHRTSLLFLQGFNKKIIDSKIGSFHPDLIGISSTADQMRLTKQVIDYICHNHDVPIILGGIHATVCPEESIRIKGLLGVCRGEGEYAMLELADVLESGKNYFYIKNFWFKTNGEIIKNEMRPLIQDLDSLPFPDYEIFEYQNFLKNHEILNLVASRGCPFGCSYCMNKPLRDLYGDKGKYVRFRSVDNVIEEINRLKTKYYNIKNIEFYDDVFALNPAWLEEFCQKYPKKVKLPFVCNGRVDLINEQIVKQLKAAGCFQVNMAIENGNERIRKEILKRNINQDEIIQAFGLFKRNGIKIRAHNMIGVPFETERTIKETIALNKKIGVDSLQVSIFYPYPETELANLCKEKGWVSNRKVRSYIETSILDQPSISAQKVNYYAFIFRSAVFDSRPIFFLKRIIFNIISKNYKLADWIRVNWLRQMRVLLPSSIRRKLRLWLHYT